MRKTLIAAAVGGLLLSPALALADTASDIETLKHLIEAQQKRIDALERQVANQPAASTAAVAPTTPATTPAPAEGATRIGGYGELVFSQIDGEESSDLQRVVLYVGHRFDDRNRFDSELEVEHQFIENGDGVAEGGEVSIEQAYVEHDWNSWLKTRAGFFLMPVGITNERHEPTAFYGVQRNPVEHFIIPTTWSDKGFQTIASFNNGLSLDFAVSGGLHVENDEPGEEFLTVHAKPEGEGSASSPAFTGRVLYRGVPGLELGLSGLYQADAGQGGADEVVNAGHASLAEAHVIYGFGGAELRALYARFELSGDAPKALERDLQDGGYVEASYRFCDQLGAFARYNVWDNGGVGGDTEIRQTNAGINWWLIPQIVVKADLQWQSGASDLDGFNFGVGYHF